MAHFENSELGVSFDLPEKITVGDQLRYKGRVYAYGANVEDIYLRYWAGARGIIQNWQCEVMPDINAGIDEPTAPLKDGEIIPESVYNSAAADVIFWVGNVVAGHMATLGTVEKN